jgi:hypothetical protein
MNAWPGTLLNHLCYHIFGRYVAFEGRLSVFCGLSSELGSRQSKGGLWQ